MSERADIPCEVELKLKRQRYIDGCNNIIKQLQETNLTEDSDFCTLEDFGLVLYQTAKAIQDIERTLYSLAASEESFRLAYNKTL